ncbi:centromere protein J [Phthorimaea operculella]|nr:centromere protein J [Phthorimaea operculella]
MDHSYSDSDVSMSPSHILERLQVLRQLQLLQRGKLQKQRLEYQETTETTSSLTEIVSHFSNSTSYNTFRSLLQSSYDISSEATPTVTPRQNSNSAQKVSDRDLIDGVSALNLSQESEFLVNSPVTSRSKVSVSSQKISNSPPNKNTESQPQPRKQIALDEMPILAPKQDFEALLLEKLKNEKAQLKNEKLKNPLQAKENPGQTKRPFLKRGEGMARFGVKKSDLIIQPVKALPWKRKSLETKVNDTPKKVKDDEKDDVQIMVAVPQMQLKRKKEYEKPTNTEQIASKKSENNSEGVKPLPKEIDNNVDSGEFVRPIPKIQLPKGKHPLQVNKGKTWAAVLTKEQDDFLRQLKQSDYYKNFTSPAKSTVSDASCDEHLYNIRREKEAAEQNMFELLENKVTNESFNIESSFFNKFLKRNLECSGESTPQIMQKCLQNNPNLLHIFPDMKMKRNQTLSECSCEYSDCSEACSVSTCSTCKTVEEISIETPKELKKKDAQKRDPKTKPKRKEESQEREQETYHDDTVTEDKEMKTNIAEMNAKLVATSELLKDRLRELEDEIETFRKENNNLTKMREEIDLERQKFYEEKNAFEQKFNEEKILSEYYLAEEKEKLNKQRQLYERQVREIRGRLNKKEKDEVINLKKEISNLREDIRIKDAKSTTTIARLRNQLKIMEKEKANLQNEVEKLKKENRRIQHSNDITRRLTNVKYLEEINKKLTNMTKNTQSEVDVDNNAKFKAYEIERQSRSRRVQPVAKGTMRPRAKSVPNFNVTSRYAKYFSQRDALSHIEGNDSLNIEHNQNSRENLQSCYNQDKQQSKENLDPYFIRKSNSNSSKSPNLMSPLRVNTNPYANRSKSPISILSNRSGGRRSPKTAETGFNSSGGSNSKSPVSIISNRSSSSQKSATVINQEQYRDKLLNISPEPSTSKTSLAKTSLNATEIKKPDGSKELRFPNGNIKHISADGKYSKFLYYNGDIKENFYSEGRIKYYYAEAKTYHTTHADGLEVLEFPDGQVEKRYKDGSSEIRLPNGSVRYHDPKNEHVREEWRFPDGTALTVSANGDKRIVFSNGQIEVHTKDHKVSFRSIYITHDPKNEHVREEWRFPDGTALTVSAIGDKRIVFSNGRIEVDTKDHKVSFGKSLKYYFKIVSERVEKWRFPDGTALTVSANDKRIVLIIR